MDDRDVCIGCDEMFDYDDLCDLSSAGMMGDFACEDCVQDVLEVSE